MVIFDLWVFLQFIDKIYKEFDTVYERKIQLLIEKVITMGAQ